MNEYVTMKITFDHLKIVFYFKHYTKILKLILT